MVRVSLQSEALPYFLWVSSVGNIYAKSECVVVTIKKRLHQKTKFKTIKL